MLHTHTKYQLTKVTDPVERQSSIRKELERADGQMPGPIHFPKSSRTLAGETALAEVSLIDPGCGFLANPASFMFDKIMPLSEALEGYEIFDNMQAQKVVFSVPKSE